MVRTKNYNSSKLPPICIQFSNIDTASIEHPTNIYRASIEHLSNIHRTSIGTTIGTLSELYRKSVEHLSSIYRTLLGVLSNIHRALIEHTGHPSNVYQTSIEHPSECYRTAKRYQLYVWYFLYVCFSWLMSRWMYCSNRIKPHTTNGLIECIAAHG